MTLPDKPYCSPFLPDSDVDRSSTEQTVQLLSPYLRTRRLEPAEHLWHQGQREGLFAYVQSGRIKIYRSLLSGKDLTLYVFGPGTLFGFTPFLAGTVYPASAQAIEPSVLQVGTKDMLLQAIAKDPSIAMTLLRHLNTRLEEAFETIERLSTRGTLPKVAAALVGLMDGSGQLTSYIELPMSSAEMARSLGISPETFSRSVSNLVKQGVIHRLGKNRFQVLDAKKLKQLARNAVF